VIVLCKPQHHGLLQREHPKILTRSDTPVELRVADIQRQIVAEWLEIAQWLQWGPYRKPSLLFLIVRSVTVYDLSSYKMGVPNAPLVICRILNSHISAKDHPNPIHFIFGSRVFRLGGSNGATSGSIKFKMAAGRRPSYLEYSNGHIVATADPFGSGVGFSWSANRIALFPVRSHPGRQPAAILENYRDIAWFPRDSTASLFCIARPRLHAMLASFSRRLSLSSWSRCQSSKSHHLRYVLLL